MIAATLLLPALVASAVEVRSATECPSSADVLERLHPLLPPPPMADEPAHTALIELRPTSGAEPVVLRLRLLRADGHVIGDRDVPAEGTCEETADAVAALIAAWAITSPRSLGTREPAPEPAVTVPPVPPVAARDPLALVASAAGGAAMVGGMAASGGFDLLLGRATARWLLRVGAARESPRTLALGSGQVDWQHTRFVAGLVVRARHPVWLLAVDAGPSLGWANLAGKGFWREQSGRSFAWGVESGVRVGRWLGRFALYAEARAIVWARGQQARVGHSADTADLPLADVALRLGLAVRVF